jgi:transposase
MPLVLRVTPHLSKDELVARFLACDSKGEKLRWQAVMLKAEGRGARDIADVCKRREDWVRRTVRRFNELGADGIVDRRAKNGRQPLLDYEQQTDLNLETVGGNAEVVRRSGERGRGPWRTAQMPLFVAPRGFELVKWRWIVERTFAWLGRYRRLSKDYEATIWASEAWVWAASVRNVIRRLAYP